MPAFTPAKLILGRVWGQLWDFPLRADVWGPVSEWATGLLTFAAVVVAARQYVSAKRFEATSQARLIDMRLRISGYMGLPNTIWITNNSEKPILDVHVYRFLLPLPEPPLSWMLLLRRGMREELRQQRHWRASMGRLDEVQSIELCRRLKPDEIVSVDLDPARNPQYLIAGGSIYMPAVFFRDAAGRRWLVDLFPRHAISAQFEGIVALKQIKAGVPFDPYWRLPRVFCFLMRHVLKVPFRRPALNMGWLSTAVVDAPRPVEKDS